MVRGISLKLRYKITAVIGFAVTAVLVGIGYFYTLHQEQTILAQNVRTVHKLTDSVAQGLQSVMLAGYADMAQSYADRLKQVPDVADFRLIRPDGTEAFRDNATIHAVNRRRGEELFVPRESESVTRVLPEDDERLAQVRGDVEMVYFYETDANGRRTLTVLDTIYNQNVCYKCHGKDHAKRGFIKLTTSLTAVENDILRTRQEAILIMGTALLAIMVLTGYMMGRSVVRPIERVTRAMIDASSGRLDRRVDIPQDDEIGQMADSFNNMSEELQKTYHGLQREQDKLTTIIRSAREGIVVTDAEGGVVLVNPAAERLLDKDQARIAADGFVNLLDLPARMRAWLEAGDRSAPETVLYRNRLLSVYAATIGGVDGQVVGSAALLRDVTEERRMEDELRRLSTTDPLTGLHNRRHLDDTLAGEFERAKRYVQPLAVLMADVDHFKRVNDEHGHDAGDRVLREVAATLKGALRHSDVACRYGGEEFVAILPNTSASGAMQVAERLRRDVESREISGLRVTISVGVAVHPDGGAATPAALVECADAALYRAKHQGRNRVVRHELPVEAPPVADA